MVTSTTASWTGKSGKTYSYTVYGIGTDWHDVGGNYIFAKLVSGRWAAVYIGETQSFKDRLPNHEQLPCVRRNGGTHIHAHINSDAQARLNEEADLLGNNQPPCNA